MKERCLIMFVLLASPALAQSVNTQLGARAAGMGSASSTIRDEFSLFNNIGSLGYTTVRAVVFASEVQSQLPGSNRGGAGFVMDVLGARAGIGFFRFGDEVYNEQQFITGIGHRIGTTSIGIRATLVEYHAPGFANRQALSLDAGFLTQLTQQLSIGAFLTNITQTNLTTNEPVPTRLVAGLGLKPSGPLYITTEVEKDLDYPATWRLGAEYTVHTRFFLRTGFNLAPAAVFAGFGTQLRHLKLDIATTYNRHYTSSFQASVIYTGSDRKRK